MNNNDRITVIIPAFNEATRIGKTIQSLREIPYDLHIVVVNDGSTDETTSIARTYADDVIEMPRNGGKGKALNYAWRQLEGNLFLFVDADLEYSANLIEALLPPILDGNADMTIAAFPPALKKGGFGLVKGLATNGIRKMTGQHFHSPISGQRAIRREVLESIGGLSEGWGIEVALTIDALRKGFRVEEVMIALHHRETGRDLQGFIHRGKQFVQIANTLFSKWRIRS